MRNILRITFIITSLLLSACSGNKTVTTNNTGQSVDLPDGSNVLLNKNSTISYGADFTTRTVTLKGEAFFNVQKGNTPFIVKTNLGEVKVLGTKFNVDTSAETIDVEVEEGTVEMKIDDFVNKIKKGQKAYFKPNSDGIKIGSADFKYKKWANDVSNQAKEIGDESTKAAKDIADESKKIGKKASKEFNKLKNSFK